MPLTRRPVAPHSPAPSIVLTFEGAGLSFPSITARHMTELTPERLDAQPAR